jgi:hypothetical protein
MANSDVNREIRDRIQAFVNELSELVRQATLESVQDALQGRMGSANVAVRGVGRPAASGRGAAMRVKKGGKRTPEELEALTARLLRHIQGNPGQRMEQLAVALNLPSKELTLPIKKLLQENRLRTKGQKRATAYYAR